MSKETHWLQPWVIDLKFTTIDFFADVRKGVSIFSIAGESNVCVFCFSERYGKHMSEFYSFGIK